MAHQRAQETAEHRSIFIENAVKEKFQSNAIEYTVAAKVIHEKDNCITEFFGSAHKYKNKELSLRSRQLMQLPKDFGLYLNNLISLDLSNNKLATIPYSLKFLKKLESLFLDHNCIKTPPEIVVELSCLRVLQLSNNCIETLPAELGKIVCLETLILHMNHLSDLPKSCKELKQLKILDLSNNHFKKLPQFLGQLESLETLIVSRNRLTEIPESCSQLSELKTLDLSHNCLTQLPCCVTKGMRNLETLNVSHNHYINVSTAPASEKLKELYMRESSGQLKFPLWIFSGCAPALETLDLQGTKFKSTKVPDNCPRLSIKNLSLQSCCFYDPFIQELTRHTNQLECLRLGNGNTQCYGNAFWSMPIENLNNPELVTEIDLRATSLPAVTQTIEKFVNLVKLDISKNNINWLCNEICSLGKLKVLLVEENYLTRLPENIGHMTALKELKASNNNLDSLPESIQNLKNLTYVDLYGNAFQEIPTDFRFVENLLGFDIDQNALMIDDNEYIRDTPYECLKKAIRSRYGTRDDPRTTGPRYAATSSEERSDASSEVSSIEFLEVEENLNGDNEIEEDWDNSADEFDPAEERIDQSWMWQWSSVEYAMAKGGTAFCPADLHVQSIRRQVEQMRAKGTISAEIAIEEGQFEDV